MKQKYFKMLKKEGKKNKNANLEPLGGGPGAPAGLGRLGQQGLDRKHPEEGVQEETQQQQQQQHHSHQRGFGGQHQGNRCVTVPTGSHLAGREEGGSHLAGREEGIHLGGRKKSTLVEGRGLGEEEKR